MRADNWKHLCETIKYRQDFMEGRGPSGRELRETVGMGWRAAVTRPGQPEGTTVAWGTTCTRKASGREGGGGVEEREHGY